MMFVHKIAIIVGVHVEMEEEISIIEEDHLSEGQTLVGGDSSLGARLEGGLGFHPEGVL